MTSRWKRIAREEWRKKKDGSKMILFSICFIIGIYIFIQFLFWFHVRMFDRLGENRKIFVFFRRIYFF